MLALLALIGAAPAASWAGASPIPWDGQAGYGYLTSPTDQLGVPGEVAGAAILPDGSIFTPSVEVAPWLGTPGVLGIAAHRGMPDPSVPLYATGPDVDGADAAWWAGEVAGVPSAVLTLSPGARKEAGIALRWGGTKAAGGKPAPYRYARPVEPSRPGLYDQPGQRFRAGRCWKVVRKGRSWMVERGKSVVAIVIGPGTPIRAGLPGVKVDRCARRPNAWAARLRVSVRAADGALRVIVPLRPLSRRSHAIRAIRHADVAASAQAMIDGWRSTRAAGAVIRVPEAPVQRALDAAITGMLVPRYRLADGTWVQTVNMLQYHAFWIRDTAVIADALDRVGLHNAAAEDLAFLSDWQNPDGQFVSRMNQNDGYGQALWALGQHVRLTGDAAFAKEWNPAVDRAVSWATTQLSASPTALLPPSDPKDNEYVSGTLTGDQLWGVAGLDAAASLAEAAGDTALRNRATRARDTLRARLVAAIRATAIGGRIRPVLDAAGGTSWGERWAAWPFPTLPATDPLVQSSLAADLAEQQEGVATYGAKYLHLYLGFRDWQTWLRAGDQTQPVAGLYATLAHLNATGGGFETSVVPWGARDSKVNLAPHAWLSAELATFVHDLIVHEDGADLVVLGALPSAWTLPGAVTSVQRLPTNDGPLDLTLSPTESGATLTWNLALRAGRKAPRIRWPLPPWVQLVKATGATRSGNELRMTGASGTVQLTWTRMPDQGPTYAGTIAALQGGFIARGLMPPN